MLTTRRRNASQVRVSVRKRQLKIKPCWWLRLSTICCCLSTTTPPATPSGSTSKSGRHSLSEPKSASTFSISWSPTRSTITGWSREYSRRLSTLSRAKGGTGHAPTSATSATRFSATRIGRLPKQSSRRRDWPSTTTSRSASPTRWRIKTTRSASPTQCPTPTRATCCPSSTKLLGTKSTTRTCEWGRCARRSPATTAKCWSSLTT